MKKFYLIAAAATAVLAAGCAKNEVIQREIDQTPLTFGVYTGKTATKAVSATDYGSTNNNVLGKSTNKGFGVFAYYTDNADYSTGSYYANFMYNQQVQGNGDGSDAATNWTYAPVKYWPNEHGTSAKSEGVDKLTFMAYAPYVANKTIGEDTGSTINDGSGNDATEGIIAMTGNHEKADALLIFKVPASSAEQIDLCYGVLAAQSLNVDGTSEGSVDGPIANLIKEKTGGKISIKFKHALAKIAIDIKNVIDQPAPTSAVNPTTTKVVVKSLKLLTTDLGTQGNLNLYTGNWNVTSMATSFNIDPLPSAIAVDAAPTTYPSIAGVDEDGLGTTVDAMVIPAVTSIITGVEIVYYVCTMDTNLYGDVSVVENHITKNFDTPVAIAKGNQYNLTVLLGLTSVKLSAEVDAWTTNDLSIDLPQNVN